MNLREVNRLNESNWLDNTPRDAVNAISNKLGGKPKSSGGNISDFIKRIKRLSDDELADLAQELKRREGK